MFSAPVRPVAVLGGVVCAVSVLSGCGSADSAGSTLASSVPAPVSSDAVSGPQSVSGPVLLDVRTPAEFAEGHLAGAVNVPVESPDFASQVVAVAGSGPVAVYCRSGNRSSQAVSLLSGSGLDVVDLGGYEAAASATGLSTVR